MFVAPLNWSPKPWTKANSTRLGSANNPLQYNEPNLYIYPYFNLFFNSFFFFLFLGFGFCRKWLLMLFRNWNPVKLLLYWLMYVFLLTTISNIIEILLLVVLCRVWKCWNYFCNVGDIIHMVGFTFLNMIFLEDGYNVNSLIQM